MRTGLAMTRTYREAQLIVTLPNGWSPAVYQSLIERYRAALRRRYELPTGWLTDLRT